MSLIRSPGGPYEAFSEGSPCRFIKAIGRMFPTWRDAAWRGYRREDGRGGERVMDRHEKTSIDHAAHAGAAPFLSMYVEEVRIGAVNG
jgi:hypothetical protein